MTGRIIEEHNRLRQLMLSFGADTLAEASEGATSGLLQRIAALGYALDVHHRHEKRTLEVLRRGCTPHSSSLLDAIVRSHERQNAMLCIALNTAVGKTPSLTTGYVQIVSDLIIVLRHHLDVEENWLASFP